MSGGRRDLLAALGLAGLGLASPLVPDIGEARAENTSRPAPSGTPPLVLGALFPATGPLAAHGDECLRGVVLAAEACNQTGGVFGRQVTLVTGDAADPDRAVSEARRLIIDAQPALIFGTGDSALSLGASEASEGSGVPYWELTGTMPAITTRGFHYLLRVCESEADIVERCLEAATDLVAPALHLPLDRLTIVLLYADSGTGGALATLATVAARKRKLPSPVAIAYQADGVDFSDIAQRLQSMKPDIVVHHGSAEEVVLLYRSLEALHWKPGRIIGTTPPYAMSETAAMIGPAFDGALAVSVPPYRVGPHLAPRAAAIGRAYEQRFGASPRSGYSLSHFAGAALCLEALRRAGSADKDKVLAVVRALDLAQGGLANGWGGVFGMGGENTRAFACALQWQNGVAIPLLPRAAAAGQYLPS
jgi:branched-chain amino acid transport system substrate-binding protein